VPQGIKDLHGEPKQKYTKHANGVQTWVKVLSSRYQGNYQVLLNFSDGAEGIFDGHALLQRSGPLLEPLRDETYFRRLFINAGALCWPNGLELSPARLHDTIRALESA
jgi:hypothetical protein